MKIILAIVNLVTPSTYIKIKAVKPGKGGFCTGHNIQNISENADTFFIRPELFSKGLYF